MDSPAAESGPWQQYEAIFPLKRNHHQAASIDAVITDPPYGISYKAGQRKTQPDLPTTVAGDEMEERYCEVAATRLTQRKETKPQK